MSWHDQRPYGREQFGPRFECFVRRREAERLQTRALWLGGMVLAVAVIALVVSLVVTFGY